MVFEKKLIELVRERKCLYQTKSRSNANNQDRLVEWHRVSTALRKPVNECRQRWRSLRDRFVREKKKIELGDPSSNHEQLWEYYNDMKFLIPSVKPRRKKRAINFQKRAKIYVNRELADSFANINNDQDEGSLPVMYESSYTFDEMYDVETTAPQDFNYESKTNQTSEELVINDIVDCDEHKFSVKENEFVEFQKTKEQEWMADDFDKFPITNVQTTLRPNENQRNIFKNTENTPLTPSRESETVTTTNTNVEPTNVFVDLMKTLNSEINRVVEEKDENDLFLECMAKKMKKLSARAKFKIQAKLLENITEELLKEFPE